MPNITELFKPFHQKKFDKKFFNEDETLIVFDTNYLLEILKTNTNTASQFLEAMKKHKNNIYIPYLVGLEFHFNKSSVNAEKESKFDEHLKKANVLTKTLNLDIFKKENKEKIEKALENYETTISDVVKDERKEKKEKKIYKEILKILEKSIGNKPDPKNIKELEKQGKERFEHKRPPGFDDKEKNNIRTYGDITYQTKFGDFLIWKDMIQEVQKQKKKKLVFVTDDGKSNNKSDLFYRVHGKTIGPNIMLMSELNTETGAELYIINNAKFVTDVLELKEETESSSHIKNTADSFLSETNSSDELTNELKLENKIDKEIYYYREQEEKAKEKYLKSSLQLPISPLNLDLIKEEILYFREKADEKIKEKFNDFDDE